MRACQNCGGPIRQITRRVTCGPKCAGERLKKQLADITKRRREGRTGPVDRKCDLCPVHFLSKHKNHKYCGDECRARGMILAIERQRERRRQRSASHQATTAVTTS